MTDDLIVAEADIVAHPVTGNGRHYVNGALLSGERWLRIVQLAGDTAFYLIHYERRGRELTDTWHETVADALDQAHFEYGLTCQDWHFFAPSAANLSPRPSPMRRSALVTSFGIAPSSAIGCLWCSDFSTNSLCRWDTTSS